MKNVRITRGPQPYQAAAAVHHARRVAAATRRAGFSCVVVTKGRACPGLPPVVAFATNAPQSALRALSSAIRQENEILAWERAEMADRRALQEA